jgi:hypothetical protein
LRKRQEQEPLLRAVHADSGVRDRDAQPHPITLHFDDGYVHVDAAARCELDGVAEQVHEHLAHAQRVALESRRHIIACVRAQDELLFLRLG